MRKIFGVLLLLGMGLANHAAALKEQNIGLFLNVLEGRNPAINKLMTVKRMAFPIGTRSLLIDVYRPMKVEKITLKLKKFAVKHKETESDIAKLQIFVGDDEKDLTPFKDFKVEKSAITHPDNIPGEDVVITGLPECRYYNLYVPRGGTSYVFGFEDVYKEVKVFAASDPLDQVAIKYLPLKKSDKDFLADAIEPVRAGYCDLATGEKGNEPQFKAVHGNGTAGWPAQGLAKGRRMLEAELAKAQIIKAIAVDLERLYMNMKVNEQVDLLKKSVVYTSMDGKSWTAVPVKNVTVIHYAGSEAKKYYTRVIWHGDFNGKFFRIDPVNYKGNLYVTGTRGAKSAVKFVPAQQSAANSFQLPLSACGKVKALVNVKHKNASGKAFLRLQGSEKILWQKDFSELPEHKDIIAEFLLPENVSGKQTVELLLCEDSVKSSRIYQREFIAYPKAVTLQAVSGTDKFSPKEIFTGGEKITLYSAAVPNIALQYTVPADGKYALIATLRGNGNFKLSMPGVEKNIALSVWHPFDKRPELTGEEFCCIAELKANDKISFTALAKDAAIGNVKLIPASEEDIAIYNAPAEIKPAVILHSDGYSDFFTREITPEYLADRIKLYPANNVFCYDFCVGTTAVNYPSKVTDVIGQQRGVKFWRNGDRLAAQRIKALHDKGINPLTYLRQVTRKLNLPYSITLRANPFYAAKMSSMNSQFLMDNPQFFQRRINGEIHRRPSYAYKEIRDFYLGLVKEIAAAEPDYLCIEFLRHPTFFGYDKPLIDEYIKRHGSFSAKDFGNDKYLKITQDIMFEYLKNVRAAIDAVNPAIKLAINFDHAAYLRHGLDVNRIMQAGLVDMISPGIYHVGYEKYFDLKPFVAMAKKSPRKVEVFPRVECTIMGSDPTPEEEKGLVKIQRKSMSQNMLTGIFANFVADGADGLRPFNGGGTWFAKTAANRSEIKRFGRFVMPYLDIRHVIE